MNGRFSLARHVPCIGLMALAATACNPPETENRPLGGSAASSADQPQVATAGVRLALLDPSGVSDASGLEGVLQLDGECVSVGGRSEWGGKTIPAFTSAAAQWNSENNTLEIGDSQFAVGEKILLTGSVSTQPNLLVWKQKPSCSANQIGAIFVTGAINAVP